MTKTRVLLKRDSDILLDTKYRKTTLLQQVTVHVCSDTYLTPDKIEVSAVEHKMTVQITFNFFE